MDGTCQHQFDIAVLEIQIVAMPPNPTENSKWLGYELHDGLLQWVIGARMQLEALSQESLPQETRKQLEHARHMLLHALDEGRQLIDYLENTGTSKFADGELGVIDRIETRLQEHARISAEHSIEFIRVGNPWPALPDAMAWNIMRIAHQAVANAIQHAGPATITVTTSADDAHHLSIEVSDNGCGHADDSGKSLPKPTPAGCGHFGMSSMQHRAQMIGGTLECVSTPAKGFRVKLSFNL